MNSIGTLYIDCLVQDKKDSFSVNKELSEDEYVRMLREYSNTIGTGMPKNTHNSKFQMYEIGNTIEQNDLSYSKALTKIYNISGVPCGLNELYRIQKSGMGVLIIEILENDMEESFESEFKFWKRDSMNINNDKEIDKNERIRFLPVKDLKFEIDKHMFLFSGCKMYCEYDRLKVALIIQNIKEI